MANKKMILDLDTGIDDAMAIAYALATPDVDLIGITSTYGNVLTPDAGLNSLRILELLGRTDIPVFLGEDYSVTTDHFEVMPISAQIHGKNGIGEVELPEPTRSLEEQSAIDFIIEAAHKYNSNLILVPTGPLTNLALAIRKDPEVAQLIGNVTLMGGALTVPGNVSPVAEANINQDPHAANEVFRTQSNLTMIGLDVTLRTLLTKKETQLWRDLGTTAGRKFADIVDYYIDIYKITSPHLGGCALHDPLAVGVALDPTLVSSMKLNMFVDTTDAMWGRTIGDPARLTEKSPNVSVALNVNAERYLERFMKYLTALFSE